MTNKNNKEYLIYMKEFPNLLTLVTFWNDLIDRYFFTNSKIHKVRIYANWNTKNAETSESDFQLFYENDYVYFSNASYSITDIQIATKKMFKCERSENIKCLRLSISECSISNLNDNEIPIFMGAFPNVQKLVSFYDGLIKSFMYSKLINNKIFNVCVYVNWRSEINECDSDFKLFYEDKNVIYDCKAKQIWNSKIINENRHVIKSSSFGSLQPANIEQRF